MLIKLLKYDLKYMLKNMIVFYLLTIFFSITTRIFISLDSSVILQIISQISAGCMISMMVSVLINTIMRSWVRFRDSIYKDESYLTHTLPVTKNNIYDSKLIETLIFSIIGFIVIVLGLFIAYYTDARWLIIKEFINTLTSSLNFNTVLFIISIIGILFLEMFNLLQCGYLGILLGYKKDNNKIGFSVIYGFISYMVSQTMVLVLIFIIGIFDSSIMDLFKNNVELSVSTFKTLILLSAIIYTIIILVTRKVCQKTFNKGVNIE